MAQTYTWIGAPGTVDLADTPSNWSPSGPPGSGASAIINDGTILLSTDAELNQNTLFLESATLIFGGDALVNAGTPTLDNSTLITTNVSSAETAPSTAQQTVLESYGTFFNQGTIQADGPAGSSFTILVAGTTIGGTYYPGYFFNQGSIEADSGNSLTISVAGTAELFDTSALVANGGTLVIDAASSAIAGGYAPITGFVLIEGGGTVETNVSYASTITGAAPFYAFADTTAGNTLKIDNVTQFGGRIFNFQAGDTIDLGTSLSVSQAVYSSTSGILALENSSGTILASLDFATGGFSSGTFSVNASSGALGTSGFTLGSDGNSILTSTVQVPTWAGTSSTWQTAADWSSGTVPGTLDTPTIGLGSSATITVTTGSAAVSVGGLAVVDSHALLQITSDTTVGPYAIADIQGAIEITAGQTLTGTSLREFYSESTVTVDSGAMLDLTGHPNVGLAANNGTLSIASGNTAALAVSGGTLLVNGGTLDAGPQGALGSGGNITVGFDGSGSPAIVNVQSAGVVTDTYALLSSDPTSFGSLTVTGGATWTDKVDPNDTLTTRGYMIVGYNDQSSNTPGTVTAPSYSGVAQLLIDQNATVTEQSYAVIGYSTDSAGSVTVQNGGQWNIDSTGSGFLRVGNDGTGTLSVLAGGTVQVGTTGGFVSNGTTSSLGGIAIGHSGSASGTVTVDGSGALLSSAAGIAVGRAGSGLLDVVNSGSVSVTGSGISVGVSSGSVGTLTVGGTGSAAVLSLGTGANGIAVAQSGTGLAQVLAGGAITLSGTGGISVGESSGAVGTLLVSGGSLTEDVSGKGIAIGESSGATGLVEVTNGSITQGTSANGIGVGKSGTGTLEVLNGGTVSVVGGVGVGTTAGGSGSLLVSGTGAVLQLTGTSGLAVGVSGTGIMTIGSLGQVTSAAGAYFGASSSGQGTLTVTNGTLSDTGSLAIGSNGTGVVTIGAGGLISVTGTAGGLVSLGSNLNSVGSLDVSGGKLTVSGEGLTVGGQGNGSVTLENAGTVTVTPASGVALDVSGSNTATIAVSGTNDLLQVGGQLVVGDTSSGAVSVANGALLDAGTNTINVGNQAGGAGTITVTGGGATLKGGSFYLGNSGATGTLTVGSGGTVSVGTLSIDGAATLNAGVLTATSEILFQGTGSISGSGTITTAQFAGGTVTATGGTLEVTGGSITSSTAFDVASGADLWLDSTTDTVNVPSVTFETGASAEILILGAPQVSDGLAIANWQNGDRLEFSNGATATSAAMQNGSTLVVDVAGAGTISSYSFTNVNLATGTSPVFSVGTDSGTGNSFVELISCFAPDTRIRTTLGDVPVTSLAVGDMVITASGTTRPVRWIGHRRMDLKRHPAPELAQPIRVRADAIADGLPVRDLLLSPDHAILLDGMLVPIRLLVNGASIVQETECQGITYFHVELDAHDVILAEHLPAESYLDTGNRGMFDNAGLPLLLHPFFTNDQARREAESCAPLATDAAWTERVWRRLAVRATQLGLPLTDDPQTSDDPDLCIIADGRRLTPVGTASRRYLFVLPAGCRIVTLTSRSGVANQLRPWLADQRRLGVMVSSLLLRCGTTTVPLPLDHPSLQQGWWAPEWHDRLTLRRWTNGAAVLPEWWTAMFAAPSIIEVQLADVARYVLAAGTAIAA